MSENHEYKTRSEDEGGEGSGGSELIISFFMFKIIVLLLLLLSISRPICAQDIENEEFNTGSVINMIKES